MDFLSPTWEQDKPSARDIRASLAALQLETAPFQSQVLEELLAALQSTHENGGAIFGRWRLPADPVLHWYVSRNRLEEMGFFSAFLTAEAVRSGLAPLRVPSVLSRVPRFTWSSAFTLDGEIARVVYRGGAYTYRDPVEDGTAVAAAAKDLGVRFCEDLFGERYAEVEVHETHDRWAPWFYSLAWDTTWLGLDKRDRTVWLLCVTDSD